MYKIPNLTRRQLFYASTASLLAIGLGAGYIETRRIEVTRLNMSIGRRIAFLTDLHIHALGDVEEDVIRLANAVSPDVVVLGGDTVDEYTTDMDSVSRYLSALEAQEKFAVMGNHEYWSGKTLELARVLKNLKFNILYDSAASSLAGKVYGLDWREDRKYPAIETEGIVFVHDPDAAVSISGRALILSGHTHGGIGAAGIVFSNSIYSRGLYKLNEKTTLYVSRGVGQIFPWRLTAPLELVIVE